MFRSSRHPLATFALKALDEDRHWDAPKLGLRLAGSAHRDLEAHKRVAQDILDSLVEEGEVKLDAAGWYVLRGEMER